jgi:hypothetical protein
MMQRHGIENTVQVPFLSGLADHGITFKSALRRPQSAAS